MITGILEERPLPVVLQQLYSLRFTGELALNTRAGLIQVYLRDGYPVYVNLSESSDLLGRIMVEMRVLTEVSMRRALATPPEPGQRYGDVLMQMSLCDENQLKQALRAQVRRKLHRLFAVTDGGYAAIPGEHTKGLQSGESLRVHPWRVIYHGVRSFSADRLKTLLRPLSGQAFRLQAQASPEAAGRYAFGAEEGHVLSLLRRGFWTLHEFAEAAGLDQGLLLAVIYTLWTTDLMEVGPEGMQPQARDQITDLPPPPLGEIPPLIMDLPLPPQKAPAPRPPEPVAASPAGLAGLDLPVLELALDPAAVAQAALPRIEPLRPKAPPKASGQSPVLSLELERPAPAAAPPPATPTPPAAAPTATMPLPTLELTPPSAPKDAPAVEAAPARPAAPPKPTREVPAVPAKSTREMPAVPAKSTREMPAVPAKTSGGTPRPGSSASPRAPRPGTSQTNLPALGRGQASRPAGRPVSFEEMALLRADVENKAKVIDDETLFAVLGVDEEADAAQVKAAFLQAAKKYHPDRVIAMGLQALREQAEKIFRRVNEANQVLSDPERREEYLAEQRLKDASGDKLVKEKELAVKAVNAELAFSRGTVYLRKRDYNSATREFDEAVRLNPDEGEHVGYATWSRFCAGKAPGPESTKEMVRAIRMSPKCGRLHYFLGVLYKQEGVEDKAYHSFRKAFELDSRLDEAQSEIRLIEARRGKRGSGKAPSSDSKNKPSSESQKGGDKAPEKKMSFLDRLRQPIGKK